MKKIYIIIVVCLLSVGFGGFMFVIHQENNKLNNDVYDSSDDKFSLKLIKEVHQSNNKNNYLISPYSIEMALSMLRDGSSGNTLAEIDKAIGKKQFHDIIIKDHVGVANGLFIKNKYQSVIKKDYIQQLHTNYRSELLYDEFKTPQVINDWVNRKTNGMIKKVVNHIDDDFVLGLANALAIDVDWYTPFECDSTNGDIFYKIDKSQYKTEMMYHTFDSKEYKYLKDDNATGIVLPYEKYDKETGQVDERGEGLEFIAILPNGDIDHYISHLNDKVLDQFITSGKKASNNYEIRLSIPRFSYDYDLGNFKDILRNIGIQDAFDEVKADFTKMMSRDDMEKNDIVNLYVSDAIHKTHIDLNEKGTKAAAVTYFGIKSAGAIGSKEPKYVSIEFNKPFIYMIRDKKYHELLFFGVVYEPNKWNGSTCVVE